MHVRQTTLLPCSWSVATFAIVLQISKSSQEKADASTSEQSSDGQTPSQQVPEDIFSYYEQMDKEEEEEEETQTVSFEIRQVLTGFFFNFRNLLSFFFFTRNNSVYLCRSFLV